MTTALIIQLVSGLLGGNAAGSMLKNVNLGPIVNSIAGLAGGFGGGSLLGMLGMGAAAAAGDAGGSMDIASIISSVAGGGVGGGALVGIIGMVKNMMNKG